MPKGTIIEFDKVTGKGVISQDDGTEVIFQQAEGRKPFTPQSTNEGIVKWFSESRGYGFVTQEDGSDAFVPRSGTAASVSYVAFNVGDYVSYDITKQGNVFVAVDLKLMGKKPTLQ